MKKRRGRGKRGERKFAKSQLDRFALRIEQSSRLLLIEALQAINLSVSGEESIDKLRQLASENINRIKPYLDIPWEVVQTWEGPVYSHRNQPFDATSMG